MRVRNTGRRALAQVPITIDVRGTGRARRCSATTTRASSRRSCGRRCCCPGEEFAWVNDQVTAAAAPRSVRGEGREGPGGRAARVPRITLTRPRLEQDPVSGVAAAGFAANRSQVEQRKLVVFAVARKGARVVAAGAARSTA